MKIADRDSCCCGKCLNAIDARQELIGSDDIDVDGRALHTIMLLEASDAWGPAEQTRC